MLIDGAGRPATALVEIDSLNDEALEVLAVTPPAINLPTSAELRVSDDVVAPEIAEQAAGNVSEALDWLAVQRYQA